jgi:hypothetical protein
VSLQIGMPRPNRLIQDVLLFPLLQGFFNSAHMARLARATSQYHAALRYWTVSGRPLALAHLYMALEALAPAAERTERDRLGLLDEQAHASHRGLDTSRNNWKSMLLGRVRRDVICRGDKDTYDAARAASDGLEHGFLDLPAYRGVANQHARPLLDYVRSGVLDLLGLPDDVRASLIDKRPLDTSPLWLEVSGELSGDVRDPDRLGPENAPFPYLDWSTALDNVTRLPDGRMRISPRFELTGQIAFGVHLSLLRYGVAVGLTDPDLYEIVLPQRESPGETTPGRGPNPGESTDEQPVGDLAKP